MNLPTKHSRLERLLNRQSARLGAAQKTICRKAIGEEVLFLFVCEKRDNTMSDENPKPGKCNAQPKEEHHTNWGSTVIATPDERFTHTELCPRCVIINNLTTPHAANCCNMIRPAAPRIAYWICQGCAPKLAPVQQTYYHYYRYSSTTNHQSVHLNSGEEVGTSLEASPFESDDGNEEGNALMEQVEEELRAEILVPENGTAGCHAEV